MGASEKQAMRKSTDPSDLDEHAYEQPGRESCTVTVLVPAELLALTGRLCVPDTADVRLALASALDAGEGPLVLDLSALTALDAPGLGVLVEAHRRARRAGRVFVLRDVPPLIARLLGRTRFDRVLQIERSTSAV